ncbi:uncharacterized protein LOC143038001 isoform X4 [Oratosquilla oratoria]
MMLFIEEWKSNTTSEIVSGIFFLFLWGLLIAGVYYRHEKMFLLWLAVEAVTLGIYAIVIIVIPIILPIIIPNHPGLCVGIFTVFAVGFAISIYIYLVVYSYYREVKTQNKALERGTQLENIEEP